MLDLQVSSWTLWRAILWYLLNLNSPEVLHEHIYATIYFKTVNHIHPCCLVDITPKTCTLSRSLWVYHPDMLLVLHQKSWGVRSLSLLSATRKWWGFNSCNHLITCIMLGYQSLDVPSCYDDLILICSIGPRIATFLLSANFEKCHMRQGLNSLYWGWSSHLY